MTVRSENGFAIPEIKVGDTAPDFVITFARMNPRLKSLSFTVYSPKPGVEERLALSANRSAEEIVRDFLNDDSVSNQHWQILANELTDETLSERIASLPANMALGLDSKCNYQDGSVKYIPMMDFKPPPTAKNLELATEFINSIGCKGILVETGASYHFYGFHFFDYGEWVRFIGKCLLAPFTDSRWIGHSLISDGGTLRISANEQKRKLPSVCQIVL